MILKQKRKSVLQPNRLTIYSHPGNGKTQISEGLPNALIIDYEDRSGAVAGNVFNVKRYAIDNGVSELKAVKELVKHLKEEAQKGNRYDYLIHDTMSSAEVLIRQWATVLFNRSVVGKGMADKGQKVKSVVTEIAFTGWLWLDIAYEDFMGDFDGLFNNAMIYNCHIKQGSRLKDGKELNADDINLTGKLKAKLLQSSQAAAQLTQEDNKCYLDFRLGDTNVVNKASSPHISGKKICISEYNPDTQEFTYHWNKIFPEWVK